MSSARRRLAQLQVSAQEVALALALVCGMLVVESGVRAAPDPRAGDAATIATPGMVQRSVQATRRVPFEFVRDPLRAAIVSGIVFGRTDDVPAVERDRFRRAGLWHLLAASGQNVALVAGLCVAAAWLVGAGRALGVFWALLAVPLYVVVVGGGPSIVRAGLMAELALVAWLAGRLQHTRQLVLASAAALVWWSPGVHRTLGFQLSYACVIALLAYAAPLASRLRTAGVPRGLAEGAAATMLCSAATAPLLLATTGAAPVSAAVSNLVAVPTASVILVFGLVGSIVAPVAPLVATPLLSICGALSGVLVWLAQASLALPLATIDDWGTLAQLASIVALAALARRAYRRSAPRHLAAFLVLLVAVVALPELVRRAERIAPPSSHVVRISFLDVGQGDAVLVQSGDEALLVDTGAPDGDVVDLLHTRSVRRLAGVVATHDQRDHVGALPALVSQVQAHWVAVPATAAPGWRERLPGDLRVVQVCAGSELGLGRATVRVLHPQCAGPPWAATGDTSNDNAVVLVVAVGPRRIALTADAESPVTLRLPLGHVDVLKVAHHGSADPRLPTLLAAIRPRLAVVSVGDNPYGHPHADTLAALEAQRVRTLRTDRDGTVVVETDGAAAWILDTRTGRRGRL